MESVEDYYTRIAGNYRDGWYPNPKEPTGDSSNYLRLWPLLRSLAQRSGGKRLRVFEFGCGDGYVMKLMHNAGHLVTGCDINDAMLARLAELRMTAFKGDLEDATSLTPAMGLPYDVILNVGVMPHVKNDVQALENMRMLGRPGTVYYLEFRNKLMGFTSFNRHTHDLLVMDLWKGVPWDVRQAAAAQEIKARCSMNQPEPDPIPKRFHNPLELPELFKHTGFGPPIFHYYHAHPTLPFLCDWDNPDIKQAGLALERPHDWRSMFLCSAFIAEVEAV